MAFIADQLKTIQLLLLITWRLKWCASATVFRDIQLKLVGGYVEDSGKGLVLSRRILTFFAQHQLAFSLNLCCLGPANTKKSFNPKPLVGGCVCNISNGMVFPADFNRTFVDKLPVEAIKTLMLGPSLIKKPNKLKQMILAQEDEGFSTSNQNMGPIRDIWGKEKNNNWFTNV